MGKKRIKLVGEESTLEKKKPRKDKGEAIRMKSGKADDARLTDMGQKALEELDKIKEKEEKLEKETKETVKKEVKKEAKAKPQKVRSKRYQSIKKDIDRLKKYSVEEALDIVEKNKLSSFDETVEIHLTTKEKLSDSVSLPHGTGKQQRVIIANDKIIDSISKGKIDFDILISSPEMMSKLAKVAKILGPKGLMPNPKSGTISDKPEELKKKLEEGQIRFKTEAKINLIHFTIGKTSFGKKKLTDNLKTFIIAVKSKNIEKATLSSTMSPGIKLDINSL